MRARGTRGRSALPPATAVWNDYQVGQWAKNVRDAANLADQDAAGREAG